MTQHQRGRRGLIILLLVLAVGIAGIDQATKYLAEARLTPGVVVPLIGDFLGLQLIYNPGAAFSFATGLTWVFTLITIAVVVVVLRVARRLRSTTWAVALGMLLGGALGNLYDRLLREPGFARGHVVDFINYNGWFVGNVADISIVAAAVLIAVLALRGIEVDGVSRAAEEDDAESAARAEDDDVTPATRTEADDMLREEPLADENDFSPEVPRAADDGADVAAWVAAAPSASDRQRTALEDDGPRGGAEPPVGAHAAAASDVAPVGEDMAEPEPTPEPAIRWKPTATATSRTSTDAVAASEPAEPAATSPEQPAESPAEPAATSPEQPAESAAEPAEPAETAAEPAEPAAEPAGQPAEAAPPAARRRGWRNRRRMRPAARDDNDG